MTRYTTAQTAAINAAWRAVKHLCSCTNWSDAGAWREAEKLERRQMAPDCDGPATWARAIICKQWLEGLENPETPARHIYYVRPGALQAFLLGVGHAVERLGHHYNGPMVETARELCRAVVEADKAHSRRIVEG
jgi:hypothetical protein